MSARFVCLFLIVVVVSCGASVDRPSVYYEAELDDESKIDQVENRMRSIAKRRKLELYEKDRNEMAFLTQGRPALFIALYFADEPVLSVTNVGVGNKLVLSATDYGDMPRSDFEELTQYVLKELGLLNLEFNRAEGSL